MVGMRDEENSLELAKWHAKDENDYDEWEVKGRSTEVSNKTEHLTA